MRAMVGVLLALSALAPLGQAQLPSAAILQDPIGDVHVDADGQSASIAGFGPLDLTGLTVSEDPMSFRFEVHVADLGMDQASDPQSGYHYVHFSYDGKDFLLEIYRPLDSGSRAYLYIRDNQTAPFRYLDEVLPFRDATADIVGATVDRSELVGLSGKMPGRGDALDHVYVTSSHRAEAVYESATGGTGQVQVADVMPDDVAQAATWLVKLGGRDGVGAELTSVEPFRASNGEATTYRFVVDLKHLGDTNAFYNVSAESIPPGWNVTLPGTYLSIQSRETVDFPVFVTTPFRHQHGTTESLTLRVHEAYGPAWATLELGVHYLAIPQPSGHHPEQAFHNHPMSEAIGHLNAPFGGITGQILMNAVEEDPTAQDAPVYGRADRLDPAGPVHWAVCLDPQLRLGLDFDVTHVGQVTVPLVTGNPITGGVLTGTLLLVPPRPAISYCEQAAWAQNDTVALAKFESSKFDLASNGKTILKMDLVPTPDSDYIPYKTGMLLVMNIDLRADGPLGGLAGAGIGAGGVMQLPLLEYHDTEKVQAKGEEAVQDASFTSTSAGDHQSPAPSFAILLVGLGLVLLFRRARKRQP